MRDKLTELLNKTFDEQYEKRQLITAEHTADYLIANGVIVLDAAVPADNDKIGEREGKQ